MSKARSRRKKTDWRDQQHQWPDRGKWLFVLLVLFILFLIGGFTNHQTCTHNCQNQPAYFYGIPLPHSSYSQFYDTDEDGNPVHNSVRNSNNSGHSSDEDNDGIHNSSNEEP